MWIFVISGMNQENCLYKPFMYIKISVISRLSFILSQSFCDCFYQKLCQCCVLFCFAALDLWFQNWGSMCQSAGYITLCGKMASTSSITAHKLVIQIVQSHEHFCAHFPLTELGIFLPPCQYSLIHLISLACKQKNHNKKIIYCRKQVIKLKLSHSRRKLWKYTK